MGINLDFGLSFTAYEYNFYEGNRVCHFCFQNENPDHPLLTTIRLQFFIKL